MKYTRKEPGENSWHKIDYIMLWCDRDSETRQLTNGNAYRGPDLDSKQNLVMKKSRKLEKIKEKEETHSVDYLKSY